MMYVSVKSSVARASSTRRTGRRSPIGRAALALAAAAVAIGTHHVRAQNASWDPVPGVLGPGDASVSGGDGMWDLLTPNWTGDGGLTDAAWVNNSAAVFGGTAGGIVTLVNGGVTAGGLTFDPTSSATAYTLQGQAPTDLLTLAASQITANQDATINATIGGSVGLTKLGAGTLTLGGSNTFSGTVTIAAGRLRVGSIANLGAASAMALNGGALDATGALTFVGPVSVGTSGGSIFLSNPASVVMLAGVLSGTGPLTVDGTGGGSLSVTSASNFNGTGNTFTGNLSLVGGGSASLAYAIAAPAGQVFSASAGTLTLGGSVSGATVSLAAGSTAQAFNTGILRLSGRSIGPGVGVSVGGDLVASAGGRIEVGDGLDDSAQIRFQNTAHLTADNGTIVLRPRAAALSLDSTTVNSLAIRNGGLLALGAGATGDLVIGTDVNQAGAWTLANQSGQTLRIVGNSQDSTAGLTLRAEAGLTRYEVDTINLGSIAANGTLGVDLRGGTIDINNAAAGKTFTYSPGYVVGGWGQLGTSAANQTQVIPGGGGATFYANGPAASTSTLSIFGGFNESAGTKASFRIANNNGLSLTVSNATVATAYALGSGAVTIDPQSAGSIARFVVGGGVIQANAGAFVNPANKVRFDVQSGGTLISDISGTGTLLVTGPGASPINLAGGATFTTTSPTFTLKAGETIGGTGTLFAPSTNLTLNGTLALAGTLGAVVNGASTGTIRMNAGDTLTMTAPADLLSTALSYGGTGAAAATIEVNAPSSTVRLGTGGAIANDAGFVGSREFRVTNGTFQADAADAGTVTIDGVNQLSIDRTANGVADRALLGTLNLNGGAFQVGTTAATSTISAGATLAGRGTFGHASAIDTVVNLGTVQAQNGQLNVNAGVLKGSGTWDPNGQILALSGSLQDVGTGNATQFRIAGSNGGRVQLAQVGTYTGGTVVDGSASASANGIALRVSATNGTGPLGFGPITLNSAALQLISDVGVNLSGNGVTVQGSGGTLIQYDRAGTATSSQTHRLGSLTVGGQTVTLQGPSTSAYVHTLTLGGVTVTPAGATIVQQGPNPVNFGNLTLNGNLSLTLASTNFSLNALDGPGTLSRTIPSGTLNFKTAAAPTFTGKLITSVGTTNFSASNVLAGGSYLITNSGATTGTVNVFNAGALNLASGTMAAGQFNLTVGGSLDGTNLNLTGGNISANIANALGTGVIQLGGGNLFLRSNAGAAFGGTLVAANGTAVTNLTVDHASGGSTTGGNHTVAALTLVDRQLNLIPANGFTLGVTGATTVSGTATSTLDSDISQLSLASLQLNSGQFLLTGAGNTTIGQMGGAGGTFKISTGGVVTITGAAQAGFGGTVQATVGTLNLNHPAALTGGSLVVNGGVVNLAAPATGLPITLTSGFLNANVGDALAGATVPVTNGSLFATTTNALGSGTVNLTGGNITATAGGALGTAQINLANATLALRSDGGAAFGGNVTVGGTNFSTISVARLTAGGGTGSRLSINSLALGGQTLNVTGADNDIFAVVNPVTIVGTDPTTINTTAADAVFQGATSGAGPLTKSGVRTLTLDGGGNVGPVTVNNGTLAVNGAWATPGVTVGGATAATLEIGGTGANNIGALTVNNGTLRFARADASAALPAALGITAGATGDVTIEYTGLSNGGVANAITVDTSAAPRKLTLAARSGTAAGQVGSFTYSGLIGRSGTNALTVVAQADSTQTDASGNLLRSPSRMILAGSQTFTSDLQHGGGTVIGKGNVPASGAGPFGAGTNPLQLTVMDSAVGGMVPDAQSSVTFSKAVTTATSGGPRARLGAYYNPAGAAFQTVNFNGSFAWNDATLPLVVVPAPGVPGGAAAASLWNGLFAEPGTILQVNAGAALDNIITSTSTAVTSSAPVYAGGGGTVRLNSNFGDAGYRNLTTATGIAGAITVLDDTTVQSFTAGHHFDAVDLRTGTYQVGNVNQLLSGGFTVNASPFDSTRASGNLVSDFNLTLSGTGTGRAFAIGAGQTLTKSGAAALTVTGDQLHAAGSTLTVTGGTVNLNTDAGTNATGAATNKLSLTASNAAATVNLNVTQHLAQVAVTAGLVKVAPGTTNGSRVLDATGVSVTGGQLDLTNNRLIVDYSGTSPITLIRQQIAAGYAGSTWMGPGIITSSAQADRTLALGFGEASELLGAGGGTFGSETVDATSVVVRLTKGGDASLDGTVNFDDLLQLAKNYNKTNQPWNHGDFDYNGAVNFDDLLVLAKNYNAVAPSDPIPGATAAFDADVAAAFAIAVPEPVAVGSLALLLTGALLRRRRRGAW